MATYTPFLNLEKPTTSERLDVLKINANWDKIDEGVSSLNSNIASRSSTIVTIPVGTTAGLFDCGTLATLFNKTGLDQSYIITTFGYIRSGNTLTMDNEVPILVYNNHMYIKVAGTVSNTDISIGVVIQYKMP